MRRLIYVAVEHASIPDTPEGHEYPRLLVVYQTAAWSQEKNRSIPSPMRLLSLKLVERHDEHPWQLPIILDGSTPETLRQYMLQAATKGTLREVFMGAVATYPEFFSLLSENNNECADYLKDLEAVPKHWRGELAWLHEQDSSDERAMGVHLAFGRC